MKSYRSRAGAIMSALLDLYSTLHILQGMQNIFINQARQNSDFGVDKMDLLQLPLHNSLGAQVFSESGIRVHTCVLISQKVFLIVHILVKYLA